MLALAALTLSVPGFGYTYNVTSTISSLVVPYATHGIANDQIAAVIINAAGAKISTGDYTKSVDPYTYEVTLTFSPSQANGAVVYLKGPYNGSDTTASTDFQVTSVTGGLRVCTACSTPAQRSYNSKKYVLEKTLQFDWDTWPTGDVNVFVFINDNKIHFATNEYMASLGLCTNSVGCGGP